jgi:hypothetical protein
MTKEKESSVNVGKLEDKISSMKKKPIKNIKSLRLFITNHFFPLYQEHHNLHPIYFFQQKV